MSLIVPGGQGTLLWTAELNVTTSRYLVGWRDVLFDLRDLLVVKSWMRFLKLYL